MIEFNCQKAADAFWSWSKGFKDKKNGWGYTSNSQCTGIVWRAFQAATGINLVSNHADGWKTLGNWCGSGGGSKWWYEINYSQCLAHPQLGDVINYQKNGYNKDGFLTGHGVMYLDMGKNRYTSGLVWVSDFIQSGAEVYKGQLVGKPGITTKVKVVVPKPRAFRLKSDIKIVSNGKVIPHSEAGAPDATPAASAAATTPAVPSTTEVAQAAEPVEPPPPPVPSGIVLENWFGNAYSNILNIEGIEQDASTRMVPHTRIYALFTSTIVLDEMSIRPDGDNSDLLSRLDKQVDSPATQSPINLNGSSVSSEVGSDDIEELDEGADEGIEFEIAESSIPKPEPEVESTDEEIETGGGLVENLVSSETEQTEPEGIKENTETNTGTTNQTEITNN